MEWVRKLSKIIMTLLVGSLGGLIGYKSPLPAGALLGSMIAVGIFNLMTGLGYMPSKSSLIVQVILGSIIGLSFSKENLQLLSKYLLPSLVIVLTLLLLSIILGMLLYRFTGMDLATSLFATSPGGLSAMSLLAEAFGAQAHIVVLFHTLRLVLVLLIMPFVIKILTTLIN